MEPEESLKKIEEFLDYLEQLPADDRMSVIGQYIKKENISEVEFEALVLLLKRDFEKIKGKKDLD